MTKRDLTDSELDDLFDAARRDVPDASDGLRARLAEDAVRALEPARGPTRDGGFNLGALLGGWRGLGGLATAAVAGVWIGIAPPTSLPDPVDLFDQAFSGTYGGFVSVLGSDELQQFIDEEDGNV